MIENSNTNIEMEMMALSIRWSESKLFLLDQTLLPAVEKWILIEDIPQMIEAIQALRVRGAPLIGVAAAMALVVSALKGRTASQLLAEADQLNAARPTAVNLMNCIDRMKSAILSKEGSLTPEFIFQSAAGLWREDYLLCERMAEHGASLISDGDSILTHCNTGGLATAGVGTALGAIRKAFEQGKKIHVYVDETRPLLQGGRLTSWELSHLGIPYTLIADNMAAHLMAMGKIAKAFVGSDRIAANGDFANKIGTYSVAVNCHYHRVPFYVVAPFTTVDPHCPSGQMIPIEERKAQEVKGVSGSFGDVQWAPQDAQVYNPAFDVTPASLVTAWVLDRGIFNHQSVASGVFSEIEGA